MSDYDDAEGPDDEARGIIRGGVARQWKAPPRTLAPKWFYLSAILLLGLTVIVYIINAGDPSNIAGLEPSSSNNELLAEVTALRTSVDSLRAQGSISSSATPQLLPAGHDRLCRWVEARLPMDVRPTHYDWTLEPEVGLGAAGFEGVIEATVVLATSQTTPTSCIVMHADSRASELQITKVEVLPAGGASPVCLCDESLEATVDCAATCDGVAARQLSTAVGAVSRGRRRQLQFGVDDMMIIDISEYGVLDHSGPITLRLQYFGVYPDSGSGLYLSAPSAGGTQPLLTTQFESIGARRAFPCMDEPNLEAEFTVRYILPASARLTALSNMPESGRRPHPTKPAKEVIQFAGSPPIPTYLVAVIIGELVGRASPSPGLSAQVTVWAVPERAAWLGEAAATAGPAFRFMEQFTGVDFALPKADLVAVPGAGGAMENWGLLRMDETSFLVNDKVEGVHEKADSASITCHEIAHQWFGDLVTMEWWDNLWLNEGFATLFSYLCLDAVRRPNLHIAPTTDGIWPRTTADARGMFTVHLNRMHEGIGASDGAHQNALRTQGTGSAASLALSGSTGFGTQVYAKAGATLGMVRDWMERTYTPPGSFSRGLERYLTVSAYSNAVPEDLWGSLASAAGDSSLALKLQTWSDQPGYPLVSITTTADGSLILQQHPYDPAAYQQISWTIPIIAFVPSSLPEPTEVFFILDRQPQLTVLPNELPPLDNSPLFLLKPAAAGLYRVDYGTQWPHVVTILTNIHLTDPRGPADLIGDAFALSYDHGLSGTTAMDILRAGMTHVYPTGGYALYATVLRELDVLAAKAQGLPCTSQFDGFVAQLLGLHWRGSTSGQAGLSATPRANDLDTDAIIRPAILDFASRSGCRHARAAICPKAWSAVIQPEVGVQPDLRPTLLMAAVRGDCAEWGLDPPRVAEKLMSYYLKTTDVSTREQILHSLGAAAPASLISKVLVFAQNMLPPACAAPAAPGSRQQLCRSQFSSVLGLAAKNPAGGAQAVWNWLVIQAGGTSMNVDWNLARQVGQSVATRELYAEMLAAAGTPDDALITEATYPALYAARRNLEWLSINADSVCSWLVADRTNFPSQPSPPRPSALLVHSAAAIHTVSESDGTGSASAFVVVDGRFAEVCEDEGSSDCSLLALRERWPEADEIDMTGRTVIPGLIDAHGHLLTVGNELSQVDLRAASSLTEVLQRIHHWADSNQIAAGAWIQGARWDQTLWNGPATPFPTRLDLDAEFPNNPVYLTRVDGHAAWVNSAALAAAEAYQGRPIETEDPPGGQIIRLPDGSASGALLDNAMKFVRDAIPPATPEQKLASLRLGVAELNRWGLTGVHDAGATPDSIELVQQAIAEGVFTIRNYAMVESNSCGSTKLCPSLYSQYWGDHGDHQLRIRSVKMHLDGALGSYGAAMLESYSELPQSYEGDPRGTMKIDPDVFKAAVKEWAAAGYQVNTHCIGDACNRLALDALARTDSKALRHRIEHAQIVSRADLPRFAELGVIASVQPTHATSDAPWVESRIGADRTKGAYAWRTLLSCGTKLAFGSDFTVERPNPMLGIYAAVSREPVVECQSISGVCVTDLFPGGWYPAQKLSRYEALRGFTADAAYASFDEGNLGTIVVGSLADFVVLDRDIMDETTVPDSTIIDAEVIQTYLAGQRVFTR